MRDNQTVSALSAVQKFDRVVACLFWSFGLAACISILFQSWYAAWAFWGLAAGMGLTMIIFYGMGTDV